MPEQETKRLILEAISVTRQRIVIAQAYALKHFQPNTTALLNAFLTSIDARTPEEVVIHQFVDAGATAKAVAESFSWRLAFGEAVLQLIYGRIFLDNEG